MAGVRRFPEVTSGGAPGDGAEKKLGAQGAATVGWWLDGWVGWCPWHARGGGFEGSGSGRSERKPWCQPGLTKYYSNIILSSWHHGISPRTPGPIKSVNQVEWLTDPSHSRIQSCKSLPFTYSPALRSLASLRVSCRCISLSQHKFIVWMFMTVNSLVCACVSSFLMILNH